MKATKLFVAAAALAASFGAQAIDGISAEAGGGEGVNVWRIGAQWKWDRKWLQSADWHLGGYWDAQIGQWDGGAGNVTDLGFTLHPVITDADDSEFGISLSSESTSDLGDAGTVVWLDLAADKQVEKVFEGTTAFDEGRWLDISDADGDYYVAHSFVTPLSIPYVLDRYVPQLAAAADGDASTEVPAADA